MKPLQHIMNNSFELDLAWLGGIVDGEGCFSHKNPPRKTNKKCHALWFVLCNTSKPMVHRVSRILNECEVKFAFKPYVWKGSKATRGQLWIHVDNKAPLLKFTNLILPYLTAKKAEAFIAKWYLTRSCKDRAHKITQQELYMLCLFDEIKSNGGEAPEWIIKSMIAHEVIPNQAALGYEPSLVHKDAEGLETSLVSSNNNPNQECPATEKLKLIS